jgi:hypothetical protein
MSSLALPLLHRRRRSTPAKKMFPRRVSQQPLQKLQSEGTTVLYRRVPVLWHLRRFDEHFTAAPVIVDVIGDKHALKAMFCGSACSSPA